jgi:hypothetical protein
MKIIVHWAIVVAVAVALAAPPPACGQTYPPGFDTEPVLPPFNPANFSSPTTIDNPYFPLVPLTVYNYRGEAEEDGETVVETSRMFVTTNTKNILGVQTRVVRDTEFVNGLLAEDTFDWFAQDNAGNVWYFGEDTTSFEYDDEGNLLGTSTEGSWEAGVDGAQPGFIMLANPQVGDHYFQEFAPDIAVDEGLVTALGLNVSTGLGDFSDVLQIYETTALEPDEREFKYYAPGLGLFLIQEDLDEQFANPEFTLELVSVQVIPEPMSLSLAAIGLGGMAWIRRRLR